MGAFQQVKSLPSRFLLAEGVVAVRDGTAECRTKGGKACTYVVYKRSS